MKTTFDLISLKSWEQMSQKEKDFYYNLTEDQLKKRWESAQGNKIIKEIYRLNIPKKLNVDYSSIVGTIKTDMNPKKAPKFDFRGISLDRLDNLVEDTIYGFDFSNCALHYSSFRDVNLSASNFSNSDILYANLSGSSFSESDFRGTNITLSDFSHSDFENCDFRHCWMTQANFTGSDLGYIKFNSKTTFQNMDVANFEGTSNPLFINYVKRVQYLKHFKSHSMFNYFCYFLWWIASDCGNSFIRWFVVSFVIISSFGLLFSTLSNNFIITSGRAFTPFSFYYYSVVTFATLGYGDITPSTQLGEIMVSVEVLLGYLMLGGLLSIFANKFIPKT